MLFSRVQHLCGEYSNDLTGCEGNSFYKEMYYKIKQFEVPQIEQIKKLSLCSRLMRSQGDTQLKSDINNVLYEAVNPPKMTLVF